MAYGNVKQINTTLKSLFEVIGDRPCSFLKNFNPHKINSGLNLKHRFYTSSDISLLLITISDILSTHGSLKKFYLSHYEDSDKSVKEMLERTSDAFLTTAGNHSPKLSRGLKFMFPKPSAGSACKRMNLFLRWMIRKDSIDFGLWPEIPASKLIIPVDTHIAKISRKLKLTKLKNVSWKMAEEITGNLKKFDPGDPVKYDFALCHIGMRKLEF